MISKINIGALKNAHPHYGSFILLSRILAVIGLCAWIFTGGEIFKLWHMNTFGEERSAVVTRTWKESSYNFSYYRNGRVYNSSTNHAEIALLEQIANNNQSSSQNYSSTPSRELPFAIDNDESHRDARFSAITEKLDAAIKQSSFQKTVDIPSSTLRLTVKNFSDAVFNTLFSGKEVKVKILNDNAMLEQQYSRPLWRYLLEPPFVLGLLLLLIAAGLRYFLPSTVRHSTTQKYETIL